MVVRTKRVNFRVSDEEYDKLIGNKPPYENLSQYIRRILIYDMEEL